MPSSAELLEAVNNTGIGPLGMGGRIITVGVHVDYYTLAISCTASRNQFPM